MKKINKRILIAEDEKSLARALELKLNNHGYETKTASNGREAIDLLSKERFDLLLLDLVMPVLDGFSVLKHIQENKINLPVIVSSNLSQEEDARKARALGAKEYIIKSNTSLNEIIGKIKSLI